MKRSEVTAELLRDVLDYERDSGVFIWRKRISIRIMKGAEAGCLDLDGYLSIGLFGRKYRAGRLAWLHVHGRWPDNHVDHIDGDKKNNAIANLRDIPNAMNTQNRRRAQANNKSSGMLGVSLHRSGRYTGHICINRKQIHLGYFDKAEDAHAAYINAKRNLHAAGTL